MNEREFQKYINKMVMKRAVKAPIMNMVRGLRYVLFQLSRDHREIKKFKNKYNGERCFIVGNGPSLAIDDLELLKNEHCFAFNRIYEVYSKTDWRPEFYMVFDNGVLKTIADNINRIEAKHKFINVMGKFSGIKREDNLLYFCHLGPYKAKEYRFIKKTISTDISKYVSLNYSVACVAIEMAIYMGFKEVYLIGVDNNITKWIDKFGKVHIEEGIDYSLTTPHEILYFSYYDAVTSCYQCYKDYADDCGVKIVNCTRGGKLNVYPRKRITDVINV